MSNKHDPVHGFTAAQRRGTPNRKDTVADLGMRPDPSNAGHQKCAGRAEVKCFVRSTVIRVEKENGGWKLVFLLPSAAESTCVISSINDALWHPLGESNPSFQDENLMS